MCVLYSVGPGIYVIIAAEIAAAFGTDHYQANFGLYYTHYILYIVIIIPIQVRPIMGDIALAKVWASP